MSRRFLFASWPFPGHLLPQLSVARALRERGHEVAFYTGETARETVTQAGFELFPFRALSEQRVRETLSAVDGAGRRGRPGRGRLLPLLRDWLVETIPDQVADLRGVLESCDADVLVADVSLWGPMLVLWEAQPLPVALLSTLMGPMIPGPDAPAFGFGLQPPRTPLARLGASALTRLTELSAMPLRRRVNEVRAQHGLAPLRESLNRFTARLPLYIVGNVPELDYDRRDLPASVHYVGNCIWYPRERASERWLERVPSERPWVHVTESTTALGDPFLARTAIEALAREPVEVIVTIPAERAAWLPDALPANVHVTDWLSHSVLLARCSALVTLGGKSTVLAAAQAGVPMVVVPNNWDKPDNARRVTAAGVGIRLSPRRLDAARLRGAVRELLHTPSYRQAADRLSQRFSAAPGPLRAAQLLEELAGGPTAEPQLSLSAREAA
ncbi:MAG TPA: nucleotide disphospho-sugar-binding domain-containing protein [Solirubrobacteraceae bacterium]|nr:nucleotide disphospho-sugar-binding domain-containing protein [Solirubrobacteraceae bacterium]